MNQLLLNFDQLIHDWLMKPMFERIQKMFHINRFDLIRYSIYGLFALPIALVIQATVQLRDYDSFNAIGCTIVAAFTVLGLLFVGQRLLPELFEASQRFENKERVGFQEWMMVRAHVVKETRHLSNPIAIWLMFLLAPDWSEETFKIISEILMFIYPIALLVELHLWDIDDVDPENRDYLFDPDYAKDNSH